jgi:alpha,alpha-trehalase
MSSHPIAEYALLSDCHSAALVHRAGSIDWLCFPRYDAPSVFGRLLDQTAGHWSIQLSNILSIRRSYLENTLVLTTEFETPGGRVTLTDALAVGANERGHQLGVRSPHALLRRAECTEGQVELEMEFAPRPEYGQMEPMLRQVSRGVITTGGALFPASMVPHRIENGIARARVPLRAGETRLFALQHQQTEENAYWTENEIDRRLREPVESWRSWSAHHQRYDGPWRELVQLSGRVLQGLTYQPTGAIIAAATTSLPEVIGGTRNWDYRVGCTNSICVE